METKKQKLERNLTFIFIGVVALVTLFVWWKKLIPNRVLYSLIGILVVYAWHLTSKKQNFEKLEKPELTQGIEISGEGQKKSKVWTNVVFGSPIVFGPLIAYFFYPYSNKIFVIIAIFVSALAHYIFFKIRLKF